MAHPPSNIGLGAKGSEASPGPSSSVLKTEATIGIVAGVATIIWRRSRCIRKMLPEMILVTRSKCEADTSQLTSFTICQFPIQDSACVSTCESGRAVVEMSTGLVAKCAIRIWSGHASKDNLHVGGSMGVNERQVMLSLSPSVD